MYLSLHPIFLTAVFSPNFQEMAKKKRKVETKNKELMEETKVTADYAEAMEERVKTQNAKLNKQEEMMECMDSCKDFAHALRTHSNTLKHLADTVTLDKAQSHALMSVAKISSQMLNELENHNFTVHNHQDQATCEMLMRYMFSNRLMRASIQANDPEAATRLSNIDDCNDQLFAGRGSDHASVARATGSAMRELDYIITNTDVDIPEL